MRLRVELSRAAFCTPRTTERPDKATSTLETEAPTGALTACKWMYQIQNTTYVRNFAYAC